MEAKVKAQQEKISIHALREEGDILWRLQRHLIINFYPRPPRGGRPARLLWLHSSMTISIHALREEGDMQYTSKTIPFWEFLSTPSARRATGNPNKLRGDKNISIHALREEGDLGTLEGVHGREISIHALREEGDSVMDRLSR